MSALPAAAFQLRYPKTDEVIDRRAPEGGWHEVNRLVLKYSGRQLLDKGFTEEEAAEVLAAVIDAVRAGCEDPRAGEEIA